MITPGNLARERDRKSANFLHNTLDTLEPASDNHPSDVTVLDSQASDSVCEINIHWLIENHHESVYRYAYRLTGNVSDAEDLTQQTFMMAHQRLDQLREPAKCLSWMLTIVRNSFLKMNRRQRPSCAANLDRLHG